jgi:hypothetical protein
MAQVSVAALLIYIRLTIIPIPTANQAPYPVIIYVWIVLMALITSFAFYLNEILVSFSLFQSFKKETFLLREKMIYPKWFYYFVMVWNLLDRFLWIVIWIADTKQFPFLGSPFGYSTV